MDGVVEHGSTAQAGANLALAVRHCRSKLCVPDVVRNALAQVFSQSALRNLNVQRELVLTQRLLESAGFLPVALKGAGLAWHVYPHPALRPLRDLDVLVPKVDGMTAYQALLEGGLSRIDQYGYSGDAETVMGLGKHLPPLRSATGTLNVELHTRVLHTHQGSVEAADLTDDPDFWSRCIVSKVGDQFVRFESPADLLFHLIVHAVYDHEFNNGPLVLSDLAFLMRTRQIDWPLFWSMADRMGFAPGCGLTLKLVRRYWNDLPIQWCGHAFVFSDATLANVALLLLRDFEQKNEVSIRSDLLEEKSAVGKTIYLWNKIFVSRAKMATLFAVRPDDWRIYFYYPVR